MIRSAASLLVPSPGIASLGFSPSLREGRPAEGQVGEGALFLSPHRHRFARRTRSAEFATSSQGEREGARFLFPHLASLRLPSSPKGRGKI